MIDYKNYLLTDFTTEKWIGIDMENVKLRLTDLSERASNGCLIGGIVDKKRLTPHEIGIHDIMDTTHIIKNLTLVDGKVYGDVKFLDTPRGISVCELINNGCEIKFCIRSVGTYDDANDDGINPIYIETIESWDVFII